MGFNLRVSLHVAAILLTVVVLSWCLLNTQYYATMLTLSLVLALQISALLRFIHATNRELSRFLTAVRHSDFSQSFRNLQPGGSFRDLGEAFDGVLDRFRRERSGKEEQAAFLQAFVQQMPIAVFSLEEDGRIPISNTAFRRLLGIQGQVNHLRQVRSADEKLARWIEALQPGQDSAFRLWRRQQMLHLKFSCAVLRSRGRQQKVITIQDIQGELEARELEAWQNLIRVMTHEIMNSVTPISSLADTAEQLLGEAGRQLQTPAPGCRDEAGALLTDAGDAIATISKRSQGLLRFVESYRSLTRLPTPKLRAFPVRELLDSVSRLMQEQAQRRGLALACRCHPATLELYADPEMLEQALINLVRNALDAVAEARAPAVELLAELQERGKVALVVRDNGCGIEKENLENIFIPFFTTKRGGSGIGMSVVRQIVRLNGGSINVLSEPGRGTAVILTF